MSRKNAINVEPWLAKRHHSLVEEIVTQRSAQARATLRLLPGAILMCGLLLASTGAAAQDYSGGLTVKRIYSQPSLSGSLTNGVRWAPDGKMLSFFESRGKGKEAQTELWGMDPA